MGGRLALRRWSPQPAAVQAASAHLFHFVDVVPQRRFSLAAPLRWCVQPWYYATHRLGPIHRSFQLDRTLAHWCKLFDWTREVGTTALLPG